MRAAFRSSGPSGVAARRLLPVAVTAPPVIAWLCLLGQGREHFDPAVTVALFAVGNTLTLGSVVGWVALRIQGLELARQSSEKALRASEERFRSVAEALPEGVAVTGPDGEVIYRNPYYRRLTGGAPEDLEGGGWPRALHPDDAAGSLAAWKAALASRQGYELDQRLRRSDGAWRWHHERMLPQVDGDGRLLQWLGTVTDIDARKRSALEVQAQAERVQASNRELASFVYIASHDLQEPLRTLCGFSGLLNERFSGRYGARFDRLLGFIQERALRMQALIQGFLTYSRVGTRGAPFALAASDLLVDEALAELEGPLEEGTAVVTRDTMPLVWADAAQIAQLFRTLLAQALRRRRPGAPLRLHLSACPEGDRWCFSIRDDGVAIEARDLEHLFVLSHRFQDPDLATGPGDSLAACKRIVERHGGKIWVEPEPGGGSTFRFTLAGKETPF